MHVVSLDNLRITAGTAYGLLRGTSEIDRCPVQRMRATHSQHSLVDRDDFLGDAGSCQMLHLFATLGSLAMRQDFREPLDEVLDFRLANIASLGISDDFADVTHIGRD